MLRDVWLVVVPGLCALHENVGFGFEPSRVVQGADAKSDEVWASPDLHVQRRAAVAAENADNVVAAVGFRDIALWCALEYAERHAGDAGGGDMRSTALALAVAAMAAQGEDGVAHGFISDCAAKAAACSGVGHGCGLLPARAIGGRYRRERNGPRRRLADRAERVARTRKRGEASTMERYHTDQFTPSRSQGAHTFSARQSSLISLSKVQDEKRRPRVIGELWGPRTGRRVHRARRPKP